MTDKIVTIREQIPVQEPSGQSYVADWATYSQAGGDRDGDASEVSYTATQSEIGSEGTDAISEAGSHSKYGGSLAGSCLSGDLGEVGDAQGGGGLMQRVWPFGRKPQATEKADDVPVPQRAQAPPHVPADQNPAQELLAALSSVTRSSSGESIADILAKISLTLNSIEALQRSGQGSSAYQPPPGSVAGTGAGLARASGPARKQIGSEDEDD